MNGTTQSPLGRLKDIALSGKASEKKPVNLDAPALTAPQDEGELELGEEDILGSEQVDGIQPGGMTEEAPGAAPEANEAKGPVTAGAPKASEPEPGNVTDLLSGAIFPRLEIMLSQAGDYEAMNKGLRDGKLELGQVDGQPHVVLTNAGIDDLISNERDVAQAIEDQIVDAENTISEAEARLENARALRSNLKNQTEETRGRIVALQNAKSGRK